MRVLLLLGLVSAAVSLSINHQKILATFEHEIASSGGSADVYVKIVKAIEAIAAGIKGDKLSASTAAGATCHDNVEAEVMPDERQTTVTQQQFLYIQGCKESSTCQIASDELGKTYNTATEAFQNAQSGKDAKTAAEVPKVEELTKAKKRQHDLDGDDGAVKSKARVKKFDDAIDILKRIKNAFNTKTGAISKPTLKASESKLLNSIPMAATALLIIEDVGTLDGDDKIDAVKKLVAIIDVVIASLGTSRENEADAQAAWKKGLEASKVALIAQIGKLDEEVATLGTEIATFQKAIEAATKAKEDTLASLRAKVPACIAGHRSYVRGSLAFDEELEGLKQIKALLSTAGLQEKSVAIRKETEDTAKGVKEAVEMTGQLTDGTQIGSWMDTTTGGYDVSTVQDFPTYYAARINGKPGFKFSGNNFLASAKIFPKLNIYTWFVVFFDSSVGWHNIFSTTEAPVVTGGSYAYYPSSMATNGEHGWSRTPNRDYSDGNSPQGLNVVCYRYSQTTGKFDAWRTRATGGPVKVIDNWHVHFDNVPQGYVVFGRGMQNGNHPYSGYIGEALVYDRAFSDGEVSSLSISLQTKWNTAGTTADPHANIPMSGLKAQWDASYVPSVRAYQKK